MYFDLCGALGYLSTAFVSLYYPQLRSKAAYLLGNGNNVSFPPLSTFAPRQLLLTACLSVWATRMGYFLAGVSFSIDHARGLLIEKYVALRNWFQRAIKAGGDSRFDRIRHRPGLFASYWAGQGVCVNAHEFETSTRQLIANPYSPMFMNKSRPCRQHVFVLSSSRLGIHRRFTHLAGK